MNPAALCIQTHTPNTISSIVPSLFLWAISSAASPSVLTSSAVPATSPRTNQTLPAGITAQHRLTLRHTDHIFLNPLLVSVFHPKCFVFSQMFLTFASKWHVPKHSGYQIVVLRFFTIIIHILHHLSVTHIFKKNSSSPVDLGPVTVQLTSAYYNRRTVLYAKGLILYNTFLSSQTMFF